MGRMGRNGAKRYRRVYFVFATISVQCPLLARYMYVGIVSTLIGMDTIYLSCEKV